MLRLVTVFEMLTCKRVYMRFYEHLVGLLCVGSLCVVCYAMDVDMSAVGG
jgi:hypothetical protein